MGYKLENLGIREVWMGVRRREREEAGQGRTAFHLPFWLSWGSVNIIFIQFLTLGPWVTYKVGRKGLFGFLCYIARENPNEFFGQCNILPRMMEKQGEERRWGWWPLKQRKWGYWFSGLWFPWAVPTPSSGIICSGWGGGRWTLVGWEGMSYQHFYQVRGPAEATTAAWGLRERSVP